MRWGVIAVAIAAVVALALLENFHDESGNWLGDRPFTAAVVAQTALLVVAYLLVDRVIRHREQERDRQLWLKGVEPNARWAWRLSVPISSQGVVRTKGTSSSAQRRSSPAAFAQASSSRCPAGGGQRLGQGTLRLESRLRPMITTRG